MAHGRRVVPQADLPFRDDNEPFGFALTAPQGWRIDNGSDALALINAETELDQNRQGHAAPLGGAVEFRQASFAYGPGAPAVGTYALYGDLPPGASLEGFLQFAQRHRVAQSEAPALGAAQADQVCARSERLAQVIGQGTHIGTG